MRNQVVVIYQKQSELYSFMESIELRHPTQ
jgi:hypothetical protein